MKLKSLNRVHVSLSLLSAALLAFSTYHATTDSSLFNNVSTFESVESVSILDPIASKPSTKVAVTFGEDVALQTASNSSSGAGNDLRKRVVDDSRYEIEDHLTRLYDRPAAIAKGKARVDKMRGPRTQTRLSDYYDLEKNVRASKDSRSALLIC